MLCNKWGKQMKPVMEVNLFFLNIAIYHFNVFIIFISASLRFHTAIHKDKLDLDHDYCDRVRRNFYLGKRHASSPLPRTIWKVLLGTALPVKEFIYILPWESLSKGWEELAKDDVFHFVGHVGRRIYRYANHGKDLKWAVGMVSNVGRRCFKVLSMSEP